MKKIGGLPVEIFRDRSGRPGTRRQPPTPTVRAVVGTGRTVVVNDLSTISDERIRRHLRRCGGRQSRGSRHGTDHTHNHAHVSAG